MFRRYHLIFFGDFMICPNCRAEIPDESLSCPRCGTPFPLPRVVEAELVHPDSSGSPHEEYRQATQSAHFTRIFYTTLSLREGHPPRLPAHLHLAGAGSGRGLQVRHSCRHRFSGLRGCWASYYVLHDRTTLDGRQSHQSLDSSYHYMVFLLAACSLAVRRAALNRQTARS